MEEKIIIDSSVTFNPDKIFTFIRGGGEPQSLIKSVMLEFYIKTDIDDPKDFFNLFTVTSIVDLIPLKNGSFGIRKNEEVVQYKFRKLYKRKYIEDLYTLKPMYEYHGIIEIEPFSVPLNEAQKPYNERNLLYGYSYVSLMEYKEELAKHSYEISNNSLFQVGIRKFSRDIDVYWDNKDNNEKDLEMDVIQMASKFKL